MRNASSTRLLTEAAHWRCSLTLPFTAAPMPALFCPNLRFALLPPPAKQGIQDAAWQARPAVLATKIALLDSSGQAGQAAAMLSRALEHWRAGVCDGCSVILHRHAFAACLRH